MVDARLPAAAGVSYPAEPAALAEIMASLLGHAAPAAAPAPLRGLVAPHAVRGVAGAVAAAAWSRVRAVAPSVRRVLLLGPSHHVTFSGVAAPFADAFATPLGVVAVDRLAIEGARRFPQLVVTDVPHEQESSLEAQLPFVQTVLPDRPIVPLLVGEVLDEEAAEVLDALWDASTLAVVSTDLSRYFDAATAARLDAQTARAIEALEGAVLDAERACGHAALRAMLRVARARGMRATCLDVRQGSAAPDDTDEVIGYGAFAMS